MKNQNIQFFQITLDDLKNIIRESIKSEIPSMQKLEVKTLSNDPVSELLTREEVKNILKVSYPTLWKYNKDGTLKVKLKIGRRVYYSREELNHLINNAA